MFLLQNNNTISSLLWDILKAEEVKLSFMKIHMYNSPFIDLHMCVFCVCVCVCACVRATIFRTALTLRPLARACKPLSSLQNALIGASIQGQLMNIECTLLIGPFVLTSSSTVPRGREA